MLRFTTETTIKFLKTERLAPNEDIPYDAIIWKSDADTGFKLQNHYSSVMPSPKGNCEL